MRVELTASPTTQRPGNQQGGSWPLRIKTSSRSLSHVTLVFKLLVNPLIVWSSLSRIWNWGNWNSQGCYQRKGDGPRNALVTLRSSAPEEVAWQQVETQEQRKNERLLGHCSGKLLKVSGWGNDHLKEDNIYQRNSEGSCQDALNIKRKFNLNW